MQTPAEGSNLTPDSIVTWMMTFHDLYPFIGLLLILMLLDVLTGLAAAFITQKLSSSASWIGMGKKVTTMLAVALGVVLEPYCGFPLGRMVAIFYSVTEAISVTENIARSGVPVPEMLKKALAKLKDEDKPATNPEQKRTP